MSHIIALMELSGIRCKVLKRGHSREVGERQHQQHRGHGSRWVVHQTTVFFSLSFSQSGRQGELGHFLPVVD